MSSLLDVDNLMCQAPEVFKQEDLIQRFCHSRVVDYLGAKGTNKELEQKVATTLGLGCKGKSSETGTWRQTLGQHVLPNGRWALEAWREKQTRLNVETTCHLLAWWWQALKTVMKKSLLPSPIFHSFQNCVVICYRSDFT